MGTFLNFTLKFEEKAIIIRFHLITCIDDNDIDTTIGTNLLNY